MEGQQMPPQGIPPVAPQASLSNEQDIKNSKAWAAVGYLGILFLIPLFTKKNDKFVQFHAKQGLVLYSQSI